MLVFEEGVMGRTAGEEMNGKMGTGSMLRSPSSEERGRGQTAADSGFMVQTKL